MTRFFSAYLNRFLQPDSIVPDPANPQDWNRYGYARNNPIRYTDPSGHMAWEGEGGNYTLQDKADDEYKRQRANHLKCEAGNDLYCSGIDKLRHKEKGKIWEDLGTEWQCKFDSESCFGQFKKYYAGSLGVPIANPITGTLVGAHVTYLIDQYDQRYLGIGLDFGKTAIVPGGSIVGGRLTKAQLPQDDKLERKYLENFLTGSSVQGFLAPYYYTGFNRSSSGEVAWENGLGVPGGGVAWTYTWKISRK